MTKSKDKKAKEGPTKETNNKETEKGKGKMKTRKPWSR